eukprot:747421-Hanusia_phi.AAC.9
MGTNGSAGAGDTLQEVLVGSGLRGGCNVSCGGSRDVGGSCYPGRVLKRKEAEAGYKSTRPAAGMWAMAECHVPCDGDSGEIEERIRSLPMELLSQRGRIGLEPTFPYLITNANGVACNFFGRNSTELLGRSLRIFSDGNASSRHSLFEAASVAAMNSGVRTYLTITGGHDCKFERMILAFSLGKASNGCPLIEMLVFPMDSQRPFEIKNPIRQIISKSEE